MGAALVSHRAGAAISVPPNELFRRETDRFIARRFGKTPLDVGADRIARTAVAALSYLREFGQAVGHPIPLLWSPSAWEGCCAIEVYPAATMLRHELSVPGYKKAAGIRARAALGEFLCRELDMSSPLECERLGVDALDAALCIVAGRDFLEGRALPPEREALARKEGWIWA
jgi:hypothetical protein